MQKFLLKSKYSSLPLLFQYLILTLNFIVSNISTWYILLFHMKCEKINNFSIIEQFKSFNIRSQYIWKKNNWKCEAYYFIHFVM